MKQVSLGKVAIATSTFAVAALLSFGWSEQRGVSLSIESAQARVGRPLTPMSVAGVARRQNRRAGYGYGAGAVGAGLAGAAAMGTAAAVAATSPWGGMGTGPYYGDRPYVGTGPFAARAYYGGGPYVGTGPLAARAYYGGGPYVATGPLASGPIETKPFYMPRAYIENGPWYGFSGWEDYKARAGIVCDPGTMSKGADGLMHVCQ